MVEAQEKRLYALVLISVVAVSLGGPALYMSYFLGKPAGTRNTIVVTGTGSVVVIPDIASFSVAIITQAENALQAAELNTRTTSKVTSALKNASSFYRVDVWTGSFFFYQVANEYQASRYLQVTTEDIYAVGRLMNAALSNGATTVTMGEYDLSRAKREQTHAEATKLAIDNAYKTAKQMADNMGVKLGAPTIANLVASMSKAGPPSEQAGGGQRQIEYTVDVGITYTFT